MFEWGVGVLTSASSLSRTTVLGNSAGTTARLNFAGLTRVYNSLPGSAALYRDTNSRLQMASQRIEGLAAATAADHATRRDQVMLLDGTQAMTGTLTGPRLAADANYFMEVSSGNPVLVADTNDYMLYNRSSNIWSTVIGGAARWYVDPVQAVATVPIRATASILSQASNANPTVCVYDYGQGVAAGLMMGASNTVYIANVDAFGVYAGTWRALLTSTGAMSIGGSLTQNSDARLKTDVTTVDDATAIVAGLRGVRYRRIDTGEDRVHLGLIAQEVQQVAPEAVVDNDGTLAVDYCALVGVLANAVNALTERVAALEAAAQP